MIRMRSSQLAAIGLLSLAAFSVDIGGQTATQAPRAAMPSFAEPAISPDRRELAFVSGGDIWTVPATGGDARLLVSHEANESRPLYSPDGEQLAFVSDRTGGGDIYVLTLATGALTRLTFDDGLDQLDAWSRDGAWIYFSSIEPRHRRHERHLPRARGRAARRCRSAPTATRASSSRPPRPTDSASPSRRAATASGSGGATASSHLDESEIWLLHDGAQRRVTSSSRSAAPSSSWPMWSGDGKSLFYVSDRGGAQNIWTLTLGGAADGRSRSFTDGRVLWPTISHDGRTIVFERDFEIWTLDTASGEARRKCRSRGAALPAGPAVEHLTLTNRFQDLALSPDGKQGRVRRARRSLRGVRARRRRRGARDAHRARESQVDWAPDSRRLVYVSERDGVAASLPLRLHDQHRDAADQRGRRRLRAARSRPTASRSRSCATASELRVVDLDVKQERVLATGTDRRAAATAAVAWSPDSRGSRTSA